MKFLLVFLQLICYWWQWSFCYQAAHKPIHYPFSNYSLYCRRFLRVRECLLAYITAMLNFKGVEKLEQGRGGGKKRKLFPSPSPPPSFALPSTPRETLSVAVTILSNFPELSTVILTQINSFWRPQNRPALQARNTVALQKPRPVPRASDIELGGSGLRISCGDRQFFRGSFLC